MDTYDKIQEELQGLSDSEDSELAYTFASLMEMKKADLVELCKENELVTTGNKSDLAERLVEALGSLDVLEGKSTLVFTSEEKEKENIISGVAQRV